MENSVKLSVLFVDDERAILDLMPKMLGSMRDHWQVDCALGAQEGLARIAQKEFDVVVSDLNMPGMNGVEFLKEVRERFPQSARIIHSSYSDQRTILECLGVIHQFLPKPCPVDLLIASVQRAAMIRSLLPNPAIREKVSKLERIPSLPTLYLEVVRKLQSMDTSVDDVAQTVARDIGMTAQILKISNSAFFARRQPATDIGTAISFLGMETVKHLVLAVGIFSQFNSTKLGGISLDTLWQHSSRTANAAKIIAKAEMGSRQLVEDATAAGLLHDIGRLVLACNFPEEYEVIGKKAQSKRVEWLVEERDAFGVDHADVGGYLLGLWGLPAPVVEAVTFHHFPTRSERASFTALTAVHVANVLVQTQRPNHGGMIPPHVDLLYLAKIGRLESLTGWKRELEEQESPEL